MKIGIFGHGKIYKKYISRVPIEHEIIAIIDNDDVSHGTVIDGYTCIYPWEAICLQVDYIIFMSDAACAMRDQLLSLGYPVDRMMHYRDYLQMLKLKDRRYFPAKFNSELNKRILIISNELGYHGASIVALRVSVSFMKFGYKVTVAASGGEQRFIDELNCIGVDVIIQDELDYSIDSNLKWVDEFEEVIVNTFPMIKCAIEIAKFRKVDLWLHDNQDAYQGLQYWHDYIQKGLLSDRINILSVTHLATRNLRSYYRYDKKIEILPVPIPDWKKALKTKKKNNKTFAVIGSICYRKGQDIALEAIKRIKSKRACKFLFAGKIFENPYCKDIKNRIAIEDSCEFLGEKNQDEIEVIMQSVDGLVVSSREETFSMIAAEAMMMGKVCIVSDHCGIAEYINSGDNGFVFRSEDSTQLANIIDWCLSNPDECIKIGYQARKTYEEKFTYELFEKKLLDIFECIN